MALHYELLEDAASTGKIIRSALAGKEFSQGWGRRV
jgi:hypothetical protein